MNIKITEINHNKQRYDTCGDWIFKNKDIEIRISKTENDNHTFLIGLHEMIEAYLCRQRGITEKEVTKFDKKFKGKGEPGDSPNAPYHNEHLYSTYIEQLLADELDVNWFEYEKTLNNLKWKTKR